MTLAFLGASFSEERRTTNHSDAGLPENKERKSIMKMPTPIAIKLAKLVIALASITILGTVIGIGLGDQPLLYLSGGVALAGSVKAIDYFQSYKEGRYECV